MDTSTTTTSLKVANTIYAQIGPRAMIMLGAKNHMGDATSLTFRISGSRKVTHIRVTLDPSDTYSMRFMRVRGHKMTEVSEFEGVHADGLRQVIEIQTGLYTSL